MANNPVGWFEIYVEDLDRAKRFYESVLGLELQRLESPVPHVELWAFPMAMDVPGAAGALVKMQGYTPKGNGVLVYFSCADCAAEASRVTAAGGRVEREKTSIGPYGYIALAVDTEGNTFGLHSRQ